MNIAEVLSLHARYRGDLPAIETGKSLLSYRELDLAVRRSAGHLSGLGIRQGDVVALCLQDTPAHLVLLFAIARLGAVALQIDWRLTEPEQRRIAAGLAARLVLIEPRRWVPEGLASIAVDDAWHAAIAGAGADLAQAPLVDAPMLLGLTSGTTGEPKAAIITHEQWQARMFRYLVECGLRRSDRYLSALPLVFSGGRTLALTYLYAGATVVLHPALASADEIVEAVERQRIDTAALVPSMLRAMLKLPAGDRPLLERLRVLISTGANLSAEERPLIRRRLSANLIDVYGSAGSGLVTVLHTEEQEREPASVGRPALGIEVEIVDDSGRKLPAGTTGSVRCRGRGLAAGYLGANAGDEGLRDGWFYPGDYAYMDDRGFLFLQGRTSEVIKRGGIAILAPEIERVLLEHPGVAEAAVVGAPSPELGEEVAAFVVCPPEIAADALERHCWTHLAPYKVPRLFHFLPSLPRNAAGKVIKPQLLAMLK